MTRQEEIRAAAEQALKDCPYINTSLIGCDFFVKGAEWADRHPHWISVDDELPPKEDVFPDLSIDVLATNGNDIYKGFYDSSIKGWLDCCFEHLDNITHWMPLPEPPAKLSNLERTGKNREE